MKQSFTVTIELDVLAEDEERARAFGRGVIRVAKSSHALDLEVEGARTFAVLGPLETE